MRPSATCPWTRRPCTSTALTQRAQALPRSRAYSLARPRPVPSAKRKLHHWLRRIRIDHAIKFDAIAEVSSSLFRTPLPTPNKGLAEHVLEGAQDPSRSSSCAGICTMFSGYFEVVSWR